MSSSELNRAIVFEVSLIEDKHCFDNLLMSSIY